ARARLERLHGPGARISEAVGRDVADLGIADRADGPGGPGGPDGPPATLRLSGKGGKQRIVPVGKYAREAPDAQLVRARPTLAAGSRRARPSPAVFLNARGGRLTRQGAWGVFQGAAGRGGRAPGGCSRRPRTEPGWPGSPRTRCGTPSPPTCSTAGRTCGWCRNCWATPRSRPRRCTPS